MTKLPIEYERKYEGVPHTLESDVQPLSIHQYYLSAADEPFELRMRRTQHSGYDEHTATIKIGDLPSRVEVETAVSPETFDHWMSKRTSDVLHKTRRKVALPGGIWALDHFPELGIDIVEAEGEHVKQPHNMREITNDSRFKNAVLACTKESDLKPEPVCLKRALEGIDRLRQRIPRPIIIAIAGASGSGKTTVASAFQQALGGQSAVLHQDDYYRGKTRLKEMFGTDYQPNWDHPIALDLPRLSADLSALQDEQAVQSRRYDMVASEPSDDISTINPRQTPIIILEGIYALHETIRGWVDFGIYVDVPLATRLGRRILRDAKQGGTFDPEANLRYILEVAEPTHARYAQDQKANASRIVSGLEAPL